MANEKGARGPAAELACLYVEGADLAVEPPYESVVGEAQAAVYTPGRDEAEVDTLDLWGVVPSLPGRRP